MPFAFSLKDLDLSSLPPLPGAVVLLHDVEPLYVAQTANMREWVRRLVDPEGNNYVRKAMALYVAASNGGDPSLSQFKPDMRQHVAEFLQDCRIHLYPEKSREDAIERKALLLASLSPKLQQAGRRASAARRFPSSDSLKGLLSQAGVLTHLDEAGQARMVDVSDKEITQREAIAKGAILMRPQTLALIREGQVAKGDVLGVAQVAGIMAAKRTHELIPMCHPLRLTEVAVEFRLDEERSAVEITARLRAADRTGVEMEALTAVSVAALTIYDMAKAVDRGMRIEGIRLVRKSGGKSGLIELE